jgi:hypothetical protein
MADTDKARRHLVVSRFNENLDWTSWMPVDAFDHVFIYNKGPDNLHEVAGNVLGSEKLPHGKFTIIQLPNVGKCDHTYLHHIIENYNNLADVNVFLPANCDHVDKIFNTIATIGKALKYNMSTFICHEYANSVSSTMFGLLFDSYESRDARNKQLYSSDYTRASPIRPFGLWYGFNFQEIPIHHCCYQGIFAVERRHVMQRSIDSYKHFLGYLSTHPNPEVGHYIERSWLAMFHPVPEECVHVMPENKFVRMTLSPGTEFTLRSLPDIDMNRPSVGKIKHADS